MDVKLNQVFDGKLVRKDLLHRIKKGTNVPTFVLEFLLAKYCASNDEAELNAGMEAVLTTLQENYVHADESNHAQSKVATQGKHRFIDKIHVRYVESEKRHWAALENFNSEAKGRELRINGVPNFIINNRVSFSGAQSVETFIRAFEQATNDAVAAA